MSVTIRFTFKCNVCQRAYITDWIHADTEEFDVNGNGCRPEGWRYVQEVGDICDKHEILIKDNREEPNEKNA